MGDRKDVPYVRVSLGTITGLAANATQQIDKKASSLPVRERDRLLATGYSRQAKNEGPLRGFVTDILVKYSTTVPKQLSIVFWGKDNFTSFVMGEESMSYADIVTLGASTHIAHLGGLSIFTTDRDNTAEWHVEVKNASTVAHVAAETEVEFNFMPEYGA